MITALVALVGSFFFLSGKKMRLVGYSLPTFYLLPFFFHCLVRTFANIKKFEYPFEFGPTTFSNMRKSALNLKKKKCEKKKSRFFSFAKKKRKSVKISTPVISEKKPYSPYSRIKRKEIFHIYFFALSFGKRRMRMSRLAIF